jgi:hypothetical protein
MSVNANGRLIRVFYSLESFLRSGADWMNELKSQWMDSIVFVMQWKINTRVLFTESVLTRHLFRFWWNRFRALWADWWMKLKNFKRQMDSKRVFMRWVINNRVLFHWIGSTCHLFRFWWNRFALWADWWMKLKSLNAEWILIVLVMRCGWLIHIVFYSLNRSTLSFVFDFLQNRLKFEPIGWMKLKSFLNAEWILIVFVMQWKINTRVLFSESALLSFVFDFCEIVFSALSRLDEWNWKV